MRYNLLLCFSHFKVVVFLFSAFLRFVVPCSFFFSFLLCDSLAIGFALLFSFIAWHGSEYVIIGVVVLLVSFFLISQSSQKPVQLTRSHD